MHPTLAPDGLMRNLLKQCETRACDLVDKNVDHQAIFTIYFSEENSQYKQAAMMERYEPHQYHLGMKIDFESAPPVPTWPEGITLRTVIPGQDDHLIYNFIQAAFNRPGRIPPSFQDWHHFMMGATNFESDLWFLAFQADELTGAALCFDYPEQGWLRQLGVDPRWRRQGLGSTLLQYVFSVFYQRGQNQVGLVVDADNPTAYRLYERVGMKCLRRIAEYRKTIICT
jgi:ribosomal protein S18 acetylase RimI-like enzyme